MDIFYPLSLTVQGSDGGVAEPTELVLKYSLGGMDCYSSGTALGSLPQYPCMIYLFDEFTPA